MGDSSRIGRSHEPDTVPVTVRYWAAARAAADRASDTVVAGTLEEVLSQVRDLHAGNDRFARVLSICSVLVGEQPVGGADPASVAVPPGGSVELLPPFAGGDGRYSAGG